MLQHTLLYTLRSTALPSPKELRDTVQSAGVQGHRRCLQLAYSLEIQRCVHMCMYGCFGLRNAQATECGSESHRVALIPKVSWKYAAC